MTEFCPHCQMPYTTNSHNGDFVHECNSGSDDLDLESVKQIGTFEEFGGSGGTSTVQIIMGGAGNLLQGDKGAKFTHELERDIFGNKKPFFRLRKHYEYIDCPVVDSKK